MHGSMVRDKEGMRAVQGQDLTIIQGRVLDCMGQDREVINRTTQQQRQEQ